MKKIGVVSQKGGVGKSTLARDIARQFATDGWTVKIADLDPKQMTSTSWNGWRQAAGITPEIAVESFQAPQKALHVVGFDLLVFDGKPHSDIETKRVAELCDLVVVPTGATRDDLMPQTLLAHEMVKVGISPERILFVLNGVIDPDDAVTQDARVFIQQAGYRVVSQAIPLRKSYQNAQNEGRSISEVTFPGLKEIAMKAVTEIGEVMMGQKEKAI